MPELPEVETVKNGLSHLLFEGDKVPIIEKFQLRRKDIRFPIPKAIRKAHGCKILSMDRRAKYLLFRTEKGVLINHLGMTGSWRMQNEKTFEKHDHFIIHLKDKRILIYNDPRRFGFIDWVSGDDEYKSKFISVLGVEPLENKFNVDQLFAISKNRKVPIKNLIMDQKVVVGIGNIYACEALFMAGIRPSAKSFRISKLRIEKLVLASKRVLQQAIKAGGSTIKDFKQAGGASGYFQNKLLVYGRETRACLECKTLIKNLVISGRSSFYCPSCQK